MYHAVAINLEMARKKQDTKAPILDGKFKRGDSVLSKDYTVDVWDPKYTVNYEIVPFPGKTQVAVVVLNRKIKNYSHFGCKYILLADRVAKVFK